MKSLSIVVLAGGAGKRLRSITKNKIPKPLTKFHKKPFLDYLLRHLSKFEFENIIIISGHLGKQIAKLYDKKIIKKSKIICLIEKKPMGTAGALNLIKNKIKKKFILINGDTFFRINLNLISKIKIGNNIGLCILTDKNYNTETNKLLNLNIYKKKIILTNNLKYINSGIYLLSPKIFKFLNSKRQSLENEILPQLIKKKKLLEIKKKGLFIDIGTPKTFKIAKKIFNNFKNV